MNPSPAKPRPSSASDAGSGTVVVGVVVNSYEPTPVWYLNPTGSILTELPQVPVRLRVKVSLLPPKIPPLLPPEQLLPPKAHTSIRAKLGILLSVAPIMPPSLPSIKVTPVAFGSMPKPNEVRRLEDKADVLKSVMKIDSALVFQPVIFIEPDPVSGPAPLL